MYKLNSCTAGKTQRAEYFTARLDFEQNFILLQKQPYKNGVFDKLLCLPNAQRCRKNDCLWKKWLHKNHSSRPKTNKHT